MLISYTNPYQNVLTSYANPLQYFTDNVADLVNLFTKTQAILEQLHTNIGIYKNPVQHIIESSIDLLYFCTGAQNALQQLKQQLNLNVLTYEEHTQATQLINEIHSLSIILQQYYEAVKIKNTSYRLQDALDFTVSLLRPWRATIKLVNDVPSGGTLETAIEASYSTVHNPIIKSLIELRNNLKDLVQKVYNA